MATVVSRGRTFKIGHTALATPCAECDGAGKIGEKRLIPEASFKDHGGPVYSDNQCPRCKGHGSVVTEAGFQVMDFIEEFMSASGVTGSVSYARWLRGRS